MGDRGAGDGLVLHGEPVVLRGDLDDAGAKVLDRVVGAAVPELELVRGEAQRLGEQLVPEADAEHGHFAEQPFDGLDRVAHRGRVARPVAEEHPVGLAFEDFSGAGLRRHHGDAEAAPGQVPQHRALDAVVVGHHVEVGRRRPFGSRRLVGSFAGDDLGQVEAAHLGQSLGGLAQMLHVGGLGADHGSQRALLADVPREGARVDAAHGEHAVLGEPVEPGGARVAVEAVVGDLAGDDGPRVRLVRLVALRVGAVVAVHRERVRHQLAAVGRVGGDLLVAGHARVEHELAADGAVPGQRFAAERGAVFEDDDGRARQGPPRPRGRRPG